MRQLIFEAIRVSIERTGYHRGSQPVAAAGPLFFTGKIIEGKDSGSEAADGLRSFSNAELTERFAALGRPTVIDRLANSTGITQRCYAPDGWATSDLALPAAKEALKRRDGSPKT